MRYGIRNYGRTRTFQVRDMHIQIPYMSSVTTEDKGLADALGKFELLAVKEKEDYSGMRIGPLRKLAAERNIALERTDRKEDIVRKLEEVK